MKVVGLLICYAEFLFLKLINKEKLSPEVFRKKGVLKNFAKFTEKHLRQSLFFIKVACLRPATLLKKETLSQVFSCEFCETSKDTFSYRTPPVAASNKTFFLICTNNHVSKFACKVFETTVKAMI